MRILSLAVVALVANEAQSFGSQSSRSTRSAATALSMSSYLDSLSAYTAYQQQTNQNGAAPRDIVESNSDTMAMAPPPAAGATLAPPKTPEVETKQEEAKKAEEAKPKEAKVQAATKETAKPAPKKETKPKLPPPPGSVLEPSKIAFKAEKRGKDLQEEIETNQLINRIGVFVSISLYVGVPLALFGLPPEMFLNKVEDKIGQVISGGAPTSGSAREEMLKRGILSQDPVQRPSNALMEGVGGAFDAVTKSNVADTFRAWVDREMELSKKPAKFDVESVKARLLMSDYYNGNYKNSGETIFSRTTTSTSVPSVPAATVEAPAAPAAQVPDESGFFPSTPLPNVEAAVSKVVEPVAAAVSEATAPVAAAVSQAAAPVAEAVSQATAPVAAAVSETAAQVAAAVPPQAAAPEVVTPQAAAPAGDVKPVSWQSYNYYDAYPQEEMQSWQPEFNNYQAYPDWQGQQNYDYQQQEIQYQEQYNAYSQPADVQQDQWYNPSYDESYQAQWNAYNGYSDESLF